MFFRVVGRSRQRALWCSNQSCGFRGSWTDKWNARRRRLPISVELIRVEVTIKDVVFVLFLVGIVNGDREMEGFALFC